jgi:hypothetical protein
MSAVIKLAHIVNPVRVAPESDLYTAQPVTFETMLQARAFAQSEVEVQLLTAQYQEDSDLIPDGFIKTRNLDRSVLDMKEFEHPRKLPLIKDILDRLYDATDADYLIYTNVDIALMPFFYLYVKDIILQGYDSFTINRRTITDTTTFPEEISQMWAQIGEPHPGIDCFVFPKQVYKNFFLGEGCIGTGRIGKIINTNLICNAGKYEHFKDLHLTFHLGNEGRWKSSKFDDYIEHNQNQLIDVLKHYRSIGKIDGYPQVARYWSRYIENKRNKKNWFTRLVRT